MSATNEVTGAAKEQAGAVASTTKAEASNVAGSAGQAAKDVAGTAKEQAATVATEAKERARDIVGETREQVRTQAGIQTQKVAEGIRLLASELQEMAGSTGGQGPASEVTRQVASRANGFADYLERTDAEQVLDDVRRFARQRTGLFLLGSAVAGFLGARVVKAATADKDTSPANWQDATRDQYAVPDSGRYAVSGTEGDYLQPTLAAPAVSEYSTAGFEPTTTRSSYPASGSYGNSTPGSSTTGTDYATQTYPAASASTSDIRPVDPLLDDELGGRR